eukprot:s2967_g1.t3
MATSIVEGSDASQMATNIDVASSIGSAAVTLLTEPESATCGILRLVLPCQALCDLKLRCTLRRQLRMEHGGHAYEAAFAGGPSNDQFLR